MVKLYYIQTRTSQVFRGDEYPFVTNYMCVGTQGTIVDITDTTEERTFPPDEDHFQAWCTLRWDNQIRQELFKGNSRNEILLKAKYWLLSLLRGFYISFEIDPNLKNGKAARNELSFSNVYWNCVSRLCQNTQIRVTENVCFDIFMD